MMTKNTDDEHKGTAQPQESDVLNEEQRDREDVQEDTIIADALENEKQKRLQLIADFQNYQKRIEHEKTTWSALANMGLIQDILEIYDDLTMALNDDTLDLEQAKHSVTTAQEKIIAAIERAGIEKIGVQNGDDFDKEKMEAVSTVDAGADKKGKVIAVITSAYKYASKDSILKPAKVVVGK